MVIIFFNPAYYDNSLKTKEKEEAISMPIISMECKMMGLLIKTINIDA